MKVQDKRGVVLEFTEPKNSFDRLFVNHCRVGKSPERIGSIEQNCDAYTEVISYQAYNEYHEPIGKPSVDWQEIEFNFFKYSYERNRSEIEQTWLRIVNRNKELKAIRQEKITGQEINR